MSSSGGRGKGEVEERRVWDILTHKFYWRVHPDFNVRVWRRPEVNNPVPVSGSGTPFCRRPNRLSVTS